MVKKCDGNGCVLAATILARQPGPDSWMSEIGDDYIVWKADLDDVLRMMSSRASIEAMADALLLRSLRNHYKAKRQNQHMQDHGCEIEDRAWRLCWDIQLPHPLPAEAEAWREEWVASALRDRWAWDQIKADGRPSVILRGAMGLHVAGWVRMPPPVLGPRRKVPKNVTAAPRLAVPDLGCWQ